VQAVTSWVQCSCPRVPAQDYAAGSASAAGTGPGGAGTPGGGTFGGGGGGILYRCGIS
jgi:hypothetical protein